MYKYFNCVSTLIQFKASGHQDTWHSFGSDYNLSSKMIRMMHKTNIEKIVFLKNTAEIIHYEIKIDQVFQTLLP